MRSSAEQTSIKRIWDRALLDGVLREPVDNSLRMLIIRDLSLIVNDAGRAPIATLAQRFRNFFLKRCQEGKGEERPEALLEVFGAPGRPSDHTLDFWEKLITERAPADLGDLVTVDDADHLAFRADLWRQWTPGFRKALRNIAETRLIEYFDTRVEGGW